MELEEGTNFASVYCREALMLLGNIGRGSPISTLAAKPKALVDAGEMAVSRYDRQFFVIVGLSPEFFKQPVEKVSKDIIAPAMQELAELAKGAKLGPVDMELPIGQRYSAAERWRGVAMRCVIADALFRAEWGKLGVFPYREGKIYDPSTDEFVKGKICMLMRFDASTAQPPDPALELAGRLQDAWKKAYEEEPYFFYNTMTQDRAKLDNSAALLLAKKLLAEVK